MISSEAAEPLEEATSATISSFESEPLPSQPQQAEPLSEFTEEAAADEDDEQTEPELSSQGVETTAVVEKWPGWPGHNVFRLIVPVLKVGSIIGRKGELVKKMCEETRARIRILEGPVGTTDRIVLISGKEDPDAQISPAMDGALRVFKRVSGLTSGEGDSTSSAAGAFCSLRLLVASSQAIHLIGKQGSTIKSIQEGSSASVRVLSEDEIPSYATSSERIVEIHGDALKVLKALEGVLGLLRKFLVDHSVLPVFEKTYNETISQDRAVESWADKSQSLQHPTSASAPTSVPTPQAGTASDFSMSMKRDSFSFERGVHLDSRMSLYGQEPGLGGLRTSALGRSTAPVVTQVTKTMQVPLSYAEDIIGIGGANIAYIRRSSGAVLTVEESRGLPDEITVEIKGTSTQVQAAEQLIEEFISGQTDSAPQSMYSKSETGLSSSSYSQLADTSYPEPYFPTRLGRYGSSSMRDYSSSFRF